MLRCGRVALYFLPQPAHMHGNGASIAEEFVAPDRIEQLLAREYLTRMLSEKVQQIELFGGQFDWLVVLRNAALARIDHQQSHMQGIVADRRRGSRRSAYAAKNCLHAHHHLAWAEGFYHVVIGPRMETVNGISLSSACGEHEYGGGAVGSEPPANV